MKERKGTLTRRTWHSSASCNSASVSLIPIVLFGLCSLLTIGNVAAEESSLWHSLKPAFEFASLPFTVSSLKVEARFEIIRFNPELYQLVLLCRTNTPNKPRRTMEQWVKKEKLLAAVNAGMYQKDMLTAVSYMRLRNHINNPRLNKDNAILAFDRRKPDIPAVYLIDRECETFENYLSKYFSFVQGIRMISCKGKNVWQQQPKRSSIAAVALDNRKRVCFIYCSVPLSGFEFIEALLRLDIGIKRAMYCEGGTVAQLSVSEDIVHRYGKSIPALKEIKRHSKSTGIAVPNVLGVIPVAK